MHRSGRCWRKDSETDPQLPVKRPEPLNIPIELSAVFVLSIVEAKARVQVNFGAMDFPTDARESSDGFRAGSRYESHELVGIGHGVRSVRVEMIAERPVVAIVEA